MLLRSQGPDDAPASVPPATRQIPARGRWFSTRAQTQPGVWGQRPHSRFASPEGWPERCGPILVAAAGRTRVASRARIMWRPSQGACIRSEAATEPAHPPWATPLGADWAPPCSSRTGAHGPAVRECSCPGRPLLAVAGRDNHAGCYMCDLSDPGTGKLALRLGGRRGTGGGGLLRHRRRDPAMGRDRRPSQLGLRACSTPPSSGFFSSPSPGDGQLWPIPASWPSAATPLVSNPRQA